MTENNVYFNYAFAFFDLVKDGDLAEYSNVMKKIDGNFDKNPEFLHLLSSFSIDKVDLHETVEKVYDAYRLPYLLDFLKVLIDRRRISHFKEISRFFLTLANERLGIDEGLIYSPTKLNEIDIARIEDILKTKLEKKVTLRNVVDPSLLGGIKVAIDGKTYDGSIRNRLFELQKLLMSGGGTQ